MIIDVAFKVFQGQSPCHMKIEVKEMDFKLKPIKLEDRLEHIRKVTPEFDYMQKAFDIDVE